MKSPHYYDDRYSQSGAGQGRRAGNEQPQPRNSSGAAGQAPGEKSRGEAVRERRGAVPAVGDPPSGAGSPLGPLGVGRARRCSRGATGCNGRAKPRRTQRWAGDPVGNSSLGHWPGGSSASSANSDCNQMPHGMIFLLRPRSAPQRSISPEEGDGACPGGDASGGLFWVAGLWMVGRGAGDGDARVLEGVSGGTRLFSFSRACPGASHRSKHQAAAFKVRNSCQSAPARTAAALAPALLPGREQEAHRGGAQGPEGTPSWRRWGGTHTRWAARAAGCLVGLGFPLLSRLLGTAASRCVTTQPRALLPSPSPHGGQLGGPGPALASRSPQHPPQGRDSKCLCLVPSPLTSGDRSEDRHPFAELPSPDALVGAREAGAATAAGRDAGGVQRPTAKLAFIFFFSKLLLTSLRPPSRGQHWAGDHGWGGNQACAPHG